MALFIFVFLILNDCLRNLLGSEGSSNKVLEIRATTVTADQNFVYYKVDETLNLTCIFKNESILQDVVLEWVVQSKASSSQNQVIYSQGANVIILIIKNLQEHDSGEYKCKAIHNGTPFFNSESSITIKVKNKKKECTDVMFQCSAGICIPKRYTCDGFLDCPHGEDESPNYCGPGNPCDDKLMCPDYRCIPITWCCESHREPNCTTKVKHSCCSHVEKLTRDVDSDMGYQFEQQRFSDMGFLQTTVYTVIGCAMAFMFIVTIIVIAICRVHVRRTLLSRCPVAARHLAFGRGSNVHGNNISGWSFYDFDFYFNRAGLGGNDLMSVNPLLVTYNINNGVQFVGRPIDPPPYCEIVTCPPKEGPPPPYASHESLCLCREDDAVEQTEVDTLLERVRQSERGEVRTEQALAEGYEGGTSFEQGCTKGYLEPEFSYDTSRCVEASKCTDEANTCGVNIISVESGESSTSEGLKVQIGESSSPRSADLSDISKGAVRKLYNSKSLDSTFGRKSKSFAMHSKKF